MTRFHTLSCPTCGNQKMVTVPSQTHFSCCDNWDVEVEPVRVDMMRTELTETWTRSRTAASPRFRCRAVWRGAETFADNH